MSDYNHSVKKKKRKNNQENNQEPIEEVLGVLVRGGIALGGRALARGGGALLRGAGNLIRGGRTVSKTGGRVTPWIWRGLKYYNNYSTAKNVVGLLTGTGDDNGDGEKNGGPGVKKNIFQSLFSDFYGKKGTIKYGDASVFIFTIDDPSYIIENIKSRSKMYGLYKQLIEKIFLKEQISGADILAFESVSSMQRSGLPIVPKSIRFYKILKRMGSLYFFYGDKCYFIFIDKTKIGMTALIKNIYTKISNQFLNRGENKSSSSGQLNPKEKNQSFLIKKILSYSGQSNSDKLSMIKGILGNDSSSNISSSVSSILGTSKSNDNNKITEILNLINKKSTNSKSSNKPEQAQLTDEMIANVEFPTY